MEDKDKSLKVFLLEYLIDNGHLEDIHRQCQFYLSNNTQATIYKLKLEIDVFLLLQANASLGNLLLHSPSKGWNIFHSLLFIIIQDMKWLPHLSSRPQLLLLLRLTALPSFPPYELHHISELPCLEEGEGQFMSCTGIVSSMSSIEKYTESASFHCPDSSCSTTQHIRHHTTGSTEASTMRDDLACEYCGEVLVEDVSQRTLADKLIITIIPSEGLFIGSTFSTIRYQGFTVILRDDLCGRVELGGSYTVIGVPVHSTVMVNGSYIVHTVIEANNVYPTITNSTCVEDLSVQLTDIYKACQYSHWTFPATIAYSFGADIAPPGVYHRLKLVLLLSLVASTSRERNRMIDILVTSKESDRLMHQLMAYATSLSHRPILHGMGMSLSGSMRKESGVQWIDAGSLILASEGICLLREINQWRKDDKEQLQHILETNDVSVIKRGSKATASHVTCPSSVPLHCSLWMTCDYHVTTTDKPLLEKLNLSKGLLDQCGLVLSTDSLTQDDDCFIDQIISTHLLEKAMGHNDIPSLLTTDDIRKLLSISSSLSVTLQSSAHYLLKGYYLTSRRLRGTDTPLTALETLISLTKAHAQLNLHSVATEHDALLAILIYEESLIHRYGHSSLYIQPSPHIREVQSISSLIGKELDQNMHQFYDQVKVVIRDYAHNVYPLQREE